MTLSTITIFDTFETWRQKDNATVGLVNSHDSQIADIQFTLGGASSVTYYVATTGNDTNDGSISAPFLTIQAAVDKALKLTHSKGNTITISVSAGTYTAPSTIAGGGAGSMVVNSSSWQIPLIITGGSSVILTSSNAAATLTVGSRAIVKLTGGLTIAASGISGNRHGIAVQDGGILEIGSVNFGSCVGDHINVSERGMVIARTNYSISGGAAHHIGAYFLSLVLSSGVTTTLTGTPGFTAFIEVSDSSLVQYSGNTFTGSATGSRFSAIRGGNLRTGTTTLTYLPGSTAGVVSSGGNYEGLYTLGNLDGTTIGATTPAPATVTTMTVNSTLDVNGQSDLHNNALKGVKAASMNGGVTTSGTSGAVTVNWANGALINQAALTGNPTYTFSAPTNANTWLTLMGTAATNPFTLTWPGSVLWYGSTFVSTIGSKAWIVRFFYDGTNYHAFGASQV